MRTKILIINLTLLKYTMSLPHDAILDMLNQVESDNSNSNEELLLMIRDELLKAKEESTIVLLAQFSRCLYKIKRSQLLLPALDLYQAESPLYSKNQTNLEVLINYYKYTFFNLVNILIDHPTEAIKSQARLFGQIYKNINTEEKVTDEEVLFSSIAKNADDLCNDKKVPSRFSDEIKSKIKYQNTFVAIKNLFESSGINRFPVSSIKGMFEVEDVSAIFAGQESLNYEIVDDVLILERKPREFSIDKMVTAQLDTANLTQRLRNTM